ncbi:MAG TPA: DinB family protein [Propionibacteriaceae bacterium]
MSSTPIVNWPGELADQLDWHWENALKPRFAGLTDEEYFAEPVPGCWSVRRRGEGVAREVGSGEWIIDFAIPAPEPAPVTTIAWRLGHLIVGVFGMRNASHFGGPPLDYDSYAYPGTAEGALDALTEQVERWTAGVRGLTAEALAQACGEPGHEQDSLATLVLHINREAFHHGAEVALLRDLYLGSAGRLMT